MAPKRWQPKLTRTSQSSRKNRDDPFFTLPPLPSVPVECPVPEKPVEYGQGSGTGSVPSASFLDSAGYPSPNLSSPARQTLQVNEEQSALLEPSTGYGKNAHAPSSSSRSDTEEEYEHGHMSQVDDDRNEYISTGDADEDHHRDATGSGSVEHKSDELLPLSWTSVASLLGSTGTRRFTNDGYDMFSTFMNWMCAELMGEVEHVLRDDGLVEGDEAAVLVKAVSERTHIAKRLPCSRTIRRRILPAARQHAFVPTSVHYFPVDFSKSCAKGGVGPHYSSDTAPVCVVKPSDWAKRDLATNNVAKLFAGYSNDTHSEGLAGSSNFFMDIEFSPIIRDRERVLNTPRIRNEPSGFSFLERGLPLCIVVEICASLRSVLRHASMEQCASSPNGRDTLHVEVAAIRSPMHSETLLSVGAPSMDRSRTPGPPRKKHRTVPPTKSPFRPGDIVVSVRPPSEISACEGESNYDMALVFSGGPADGVSSRPRISLVFSLSNRSSSSPTPSAAPVRQFPVLDVYSSGARGRFLCESYHDGSGYATPCGDLSDGRKYVVYRFLLYSDGFTPYAGMKGSVGGCYMLPLGLSPHTTSRVGALRRLGLTPPGISTNHVLSTIIPDIVKGSTDGFDMTTADGTEFTVYLDCVGFVGDYPAVSEVLDLLGHTSNAPCHLCSFTRYDKSGRGTSAYAYTSKICSSHPSFIRNGGRVAEIRASDEDPQTLRQLGLQPHERIMTRSQPLHALSAALRRARAFVPLTSHGIRVVPCVFDPYRSCVVAPDHLFLGISQNVINCMLRLVPVEVRKVAHVLTEEALQRNHLVYQKEVFSVTKMEVHSMSVSAMYSLLLVAPSSFKNAISINGLGRLPGRDREDIGLALDILESFQEIVAWVHFRPESLLDGGNYVGSFLGGQRRLYLIEMQEKCRNLVSNMSTLCARSEHAKRHLDKPNVHRLVEFFSFTLPAFGNVFHIQELVLERGHQELKCGILRSNFKNPQLQAMESVTGNDWVNRLGLELEDVTDTGHGWSDSVIRSVLRLLGRPEWNRELTDDIKGRVKAMFPPPVLMTIRSNQRFLSSLLHTSYIWILSGQIRTESEVNCVEAHVHPGDWIRDRQEVKETLLRHLALTRQRMTSNDESSTIPDVEIMEFKEAKWCVVYGRAQATRVVLNSIRPGDVIQKVSDSTTVRPTSPDLCNIEEDSSNLENPDIREMWMVAAILGTDVNDSEHAASAHILGVPCNIRNSVLCVSETARARYLIPLTRNVRRVMLVHICTKNCKVLPDGGVHHSEILHYGGKFMPFGRSEGYPPRRS